MPITRTAMIEDDGSGTTGTIFNNAWKQELYGQIDAFVPLSPLTKLCVGPNLRASVAGAYYNYRPTNGENTVIWMLEPTAAVDLTGIQAEAPGTEHLIVNASGLAITIHNQHTGSAVGNRIISPGYTNFPLGSWLSIWVVYLAAPHNCWIAIKA